MRKLIKGKIYLINWVDTFSIIGWKEKHEVEELCKENKEWIHTVGFYMGQMHGYEVFSAQFTSNEKMKPWSSQICIPKTVIKRIERLA